MLDAFYFLFGCVTTLALIYLYSISNKPKRLCIEFEDEARRKIESLRVLTEKTDCVRVVCCALATYEVLQLATKDGKTVALIDNDAKEYQEVELP